MVGARVVYGYIAVVFILRLGPASTSGSILHMSRYFLVSYYTNSKKKYLGKFSEIFFPRKLPGINELITYFFSENFLKFLRRSGLGFYRDTCHNRSVYFMTWPGFDKRVDRPHYFFVKECSKQCILTTWPSCDTLVVITSPHLLPHYCCVFSF